MPEFNTQAEVDAHNATVKIQREAAGQFADNQKMSCYSKAIIHDLFPFATLKPQGNLGPSGYSWRYKKDRLEKLWVNNTNTIHNTLPLDPKDRAVVSHTLCPVEVWESALRLGWRSDESDSQWHAKVIAEAQRILTEREARP